MTTQSFSEEKLKDNRMRQVVDKITGEASQEFENMFPANRPSRVVIRTKDGSNTQSTWSIPRVTRASR